MARRKRYSAEFKRQALKRADRPGVTDVLVCEEPGISSRLLRRWRDAVTCPAYRHEYECRHANDLCPFCVPKNNPI